MSKLNVLIPAYNASERIEVCLGSIVSQDYDDMRVLIADDGSTDNTLEILRRYEDKYPFVTVYHKENSKESSTRNYLLDRADGEWILWVDADDYLPEHAISDMMSAVSDEIDILVYGYEEKPARTAEHVFTGQRTEYFGRDLLNLISRLPDDTALAIFTPWSKLYRRKLIRENNLRYNENARIGSDVIFSCTYYQYVKKAVVLDKACYVYWRAVGSVASYGHTIERIAYSRPLALHEYLEVFNKAGEPYSPLACEKGFFTVKVIIVNILREKQISLAQVYHYYSEIINNEEVRMCLRKGRIHGFLDFIIRISVFVPARACAAFGLFMCNKLFGRNYKGF